MTSAPPITAVMSIGPSSTSDVITFNQDLHHIYSSLYLPVDQSDLVNWTWNMHENSYKFEWKTWRKIKRISCLDDTFSGILKLEGCLVEGQKLYQKGNKKRKRKCRSTLPEKNAKKPKLGHLSLWGQIWGQISICAHGGTKCQNTMLVERKACCHVANSFWVDWR